MIKTEAVRHLVPVTLNTLPARCPDGCEHHNAITCIAEKEHISRFEAMLMYIVGDIDTQFGGCSCPCHRTHDNWQVDEQTWLARVRKSARKDRAVAR